MLDIDPEPFSDPVPISRVRLQKVPNLFFLMCLGMFPRLPTILLIRPFFASGFIRRKRFPGTRHCSRNLSGRTLRDEEGGISAVVLPKVSDLPTDSGLGERS